MGYETEIRGEQAGGGLVIGQNKDNQIVFVGKKVINQKRSNLTKSLEAAFAPARQKAKIAGIKPAKLIDCRSVALPFRYELSSFGTRNSLA